METILCSFQKTLDDDIEHIAALVSRLPDHLQTRLVLRDTVFYESVLERMRQPRLLRDGHALSMDLLELFAGQLSMTAPQSRPE